MQNSANCTILSLIQRKQSMILHAPILTFLPLRGCHIHQNPSCRFGVKLYRRLTKMVGRERKPCPLTSGLSATATNSNNLTCFIPQGDSAGV